MESYNEDSFKFIENLSYNFNYSYLKFLSAILIFKYKKYYIHDLSRLLKLSLSKIFKIKMIDTHKLIYKNFLVNNGLVFLSKKQMDIFDELYNYDYYKIAVTDKEIVEHLINVNNYCYIMFDKKIFFEHLVNKYYILNKNLKMDYIYYVYYSVLSNIDNYIRILDSLIQKSCDSSENKLVEQIIFNKEIIFILKQLNIIYLEDLRKISLYVLIFLYDINIDEFIIALKNNLNEVLINIQYSSKINEKYSKLLTDREQEIFYQRKINLNTLVKISKDFSITRERVRQIEYKAKLKIFFIINGYKGFLNFLVKKLMFKYNTNIIDETIMCQNYGDIAVKLKAIVNNIIDFDFKYDFKYKVFYISSNNQEVDDYIKRIYSKLKVVIKSREIAQILNKYEIGIRNFVYNIIINNYHFKNNVYTKKELKLSNLIMIAVDTLFPIGYQISNPLHYKKLAEYFKEIFPSYELLINERAIKTTFYNHNYCLINKGTYINSIYIIKINNDLIEEIINWIYDNYETIDYGTIFKKFQKDLKTYGIDNKYYLKGVLDKEISDIFYTSRDYISKNINPSIKNSVIDYIEQFSGEFYISQLKSYFPGLNDYAFYNILYSLENIISLNNKRYISTKNLIITEQTKKELRLQIEILFEQLKTDYISSGKLYIQLLFFSPKTIDKIAVVEDQYDLFSIIKVIFKDKYYFRRPIISKHPDIKNQLEILFNYIYSLDVITKSKIDSYVSRMNIRSYNSYSDLIDSLADNYVQVDMDKLVKKEIFDLSERNKNEVQLTIFNIIKKYGFINTSKFKTYIFFPKLAYSWNSYLLAGIVRSYLSKNYVIENTNKYYNKTEFIIRRIRNDRN